MMQEEPKELTKEEKKAIAALKRLAKTWPKSLWLFSNGNMSVLKFKEDGSPAYNETEEVNQDFIVASIPGIYSEGGDW
jgi:hypothetical protein